MPIWLRKFTARKISDYNEKQSKDMKKASKKSNSDKISSGPSINKPTYSTKGRK